jgi:hypothetical protein
MPRTIVNGHELSTVELDWKQVFYTNCGMVSASNVDQELGWCRTDFAAIGVDYSPTCAAGARTIGTRTTYTTSTT